ncbi:MAG: Dipeptide transport system permease protein DppC [candidate division WS2 bacterium]|nr:Dipeptide transport system permease protein DppC [Candidatus Lithacetigena glycinireducens]MBT9174747.1 Dipeptide transport system permease protein DppC [Candidatus Lithacetigena glycinireducens]
MAKVSKIESTEFDLSEKEYSYWGVVWRRFRRHRMAIGGLVTLTFIVLFAIIAPLISPYTFDAISLEDKFSRPSSKFILGTDELGRDVLVRLAYGGRVSLFVAVIASLSSLLVGAIIGSIAGFFGGWLDNVLMRLVDVLLSIPTFPLLMLLAMYFGGSLWNIILIFTVLGWMGESRLIRGYFLSLKESEFVEAALAIGASSRRIIFRHIMPNALAILIVSVTLSVGGVILFEAALSYLGLGIQPPTPSWGNMLQRSMEYILGAPVEGGGPPWWLTFYPGLMILLTALSVNFIGDGLRDALDPRLKL